MEDRRPGVPLAHYLKDAALFGVRFSCAECQASHDVSIVDVVARLKATGKGDERTGVRAVAWLATRPCAHCGALAWETRPVWRPILRKPGP